MRKLLLPLLSMFLIPMAGSAQRFNPEEEIYLLIRGDDIGSSHAANVGCIAAYRNGIMKSVELMPPCPWFPEAVKMLKENPELDVGIHLVLTSEWENMKWGPLTEAPSITDEDGYFYPMVWKRDDFPPNTSLQEADWDIGEIEKELRAQIEFTLKHIPWASHAGIHMGATGLDPEIRKVTDRLIKEYDLDIDMGHYPFKRFEGWGEATTLPERIDNFAAALERLEPGCYLFIDHPAVNSPEMQAIWHTGYEDVAIDREWVTRVFTSDKIKRAIHKKGIQLISYKDLHDAVSADH